MTANFSQTQSAKVGDQVLPMAIGLEAPAALQYSEIRQRYGEIFGLGYLRQMHHRAADSMLIELT